MARHQASHEKEVGIQSDAALQHFARLSPEKGNCVKMSGEKGVPHTRLRSDYPPTDAGEGLLLLVLYFAHGRTDSD
ncbi:hypothetical protein BaRGS_00009320 [Batillaria attramentaria]|uniref:Uncharacterized protein n=1 Tax=Batillaria attramentaria TaxID=370345 RepID=A0ABD0LIU0_9CAEN